MRQELRHALRSADSTRARPDVIRPALRAAVISAARARRRLVMPLQRSAACIMRRCFRILGWWQDGLRGAPPGLDDRRKHRSPAVLGTPRTGRDLVSVGLL